MVNIKVEHKDTVRRFALDSKAGWIELEAKLRTLFNIPKLTPFTLSYTDEDNDVITLSTDIELHEIFASNSTIKFNLKFSTTDDLSDTDDYSDNDWVLEGARKGAASATTIETDNSVLQSNVSNVSHKNIISTTNQELQDTESESESDNDIIIKTLNKKAQVDDDFETLEKSPGNVESVEKSPDDDESLEKSPGNVENVEKSPSNVESIEKTPNNIESVEKSNDVESVENDIERAEKLPSGMKEQNFNTVSKELENVIGERPVTPESVERSTDLFVETSKDDSDRVEKTNESVRISSESPDMIVEESLVDSGRISPLSPISTTSTDLFVESLSDDSGRVENLLNDVDRVENSSNKKISRVNLLDDEFFDSFNSFKISPTIVPFEPKPIPQPQPQLEVENEKEDLGDEETIGTLSSNNFSPFSERIQPRRQEDQNSSDVEEELREEELREVIGKYVKKDPQLAASVIDDIRSSIHVDYERFESFHRPTQSKEDKRNYFRQRPITSPISGRSRSATPPRSVYNNRSSTPDYNRSSTGYNRSPARSSTPDNRNNRDNRSSSPTPDYRSSTPPPIPGSFPVPASTPCLWINGNEDEPPRPDSNTNQRGGRRRGGRRGNYRYRSNNRNQRNVEQSTNVGEETPDREEIPEPKVNQRYREEIKTYREEIKILTEMGFNKSVNQYIELLIRHEGNMDTVTEELLATLK